MDDILEVGEKIFDVNNLKSKLNKEFEMKDIRSASKILEIAIRRCIVEGKFFIT